MQESQDLQAEHSWTFSLFSRNDSPKLLRSLISRPSSTSTASQSMSVTESGGGSTVAAVGGESSTTVAAAAEKHPPPPQRSHVGTFRKISFTRRSKLRKAMEESGSTAAAQSSAISIRRDFCSAAAADSCDLLDVGTSANSAAAAAPTSKQPPQQSPKEQPKSQPSQDTEAALAAAAASTAVASTASTEVGAAAIASASAAVESKAVQQEAENEEPSSRPASSACEKKHSVGGGTSGRTSSSKSARSSRRERERDCVISRDADSAFECGSGPMVLPQAAGNKRSARKLQRTSSSETEKSASRKSIGSNKKGKPALQAIHSGEQVLRCCAPPDFMCL